MISTVAITYELIVHSYKKKWKKLSPGGMEEWERNKKMTSIMARIISPVFTQFPQEQSSRAFEEPKT